MSKKKNAPFPVMQICECQQITSRARILIERNVQQSI
jgi:hypothetical protein